jgi:hypothetical protein
MFIKRAPHRFFSHAGRQTSDENGIEQPAGPAITILALAICWWALIQTTLDFVLTDGDVALSGTIGTRLIEVVAGLAVVVDARFARPTFCFLCAMSVLAVGPRIPIEFTDSLLASAMSFIDCLAKTLFLVCALGLPAWKSGKGKDVSQSASKEPTVWQRDEANKHVFRKPTSG